MAKTKKKGSRYTSPKAKLAQVLCRHRSAIYGRPVGHRYTERRRRRLKINETNVIAEMEYGNWEPYSTHCCGCGKLKE